MINSIEEGVNTLLSVYGIKCEDTWEYIKGKDKFLDYVKINGILYPLFWWRYEPRILAMRGKYKSIEVCSGKFNSTVAKDIPLDSLLYKELDLVEYLSESKIKYVTCFENKNAMNILVRLNNSTLFTYEIASNLPKNTDEQERHSLWGRKGMLSSRVISTKTTPNAVYMYTDNPNPYTFNDTMLYLYGLSSLDVQKVTTIVLMLSDKTLLENLLEKDNYYKKIIDLCHKSAINNERMVVEK